MIEKNVWNMDLYANKKIKITKNALTGEELLTLTNKKFYSTNSSQKDDKYLSYITPIKEPKSISKVINLTEQNKNSFSAMDIETMDFNGKELPISISIKTKNISKIFLFLLPEPPKQRDNNKLLVELNNALRDLWDKFFDFILVNCNKDVIFVHNLGNFDGFFIYK
jgi:hypothetical protein